jgi:hypothetical protein
VVLSTTINELGLCTAPARRETAGVAMRVLSTGEGPPPTDAAFRHIVESTRPEPREAMALIESLCPMDDKIDRVVRCQGHPVDDRDGLVVRDDGCGPEKNRRRVFQDLDVSCRHCASFRYLLIGEYPFADVE